MTLPVGSRPPDRVATSNTLPPTRIVLMDGVFAMAGVTGVTTKLSDPQAVCTGALFVSPPYKATNQYVPGASIVNGEDGYMPFPETVTDDC